MNQIEESVKALLNYEKIASKTTAQERDQAVLKKWHLSALWNFKNFKLLSNASKDMFMMLYKINIKNLIIYLNIIKITKCFKWQSEKSQTIAHLCYSHFHNQNEWVQSKLFKSLGNFELFLTTRELNEKWILRIERLSFKESLLIVLKSLFKWSHWSISVWHGTA